MAIRRALEREHTPAKARFLSGLAALAEVFDTTLSTARAELYWTALADLPADALQAAMATALREATFFPRPAELRALARPAVDVGEAYAALVRALGAPGAYHKKPALPPLLEVLVARLGGWRAVALMPEAERWQRVERVWPALRVAAVARAQWALPEPSRAGSTRAPENTPGSRQERAGDARGPRRAAAQAPLAEES